MGEPGTSPVADGERYRVSGEIGRGAMGRVLLAWDTLLDREVAIKEVLPGALPGTVRRFLAEARLTAGLQHPGIVPVYDAGERPDGTLYYVMKRVRGQTLEGRLATCRDIESRLRLLDRVVAVCQAVAHAHAAGVLHRDLKPENVMIGERGETLVVDWGLAVLVDGVRPGVVGTPSYMSPEQARGEPATMQSDVWSIGILLYEMLAGAPPYHGEDGWEVVDRVASEPPPPVRTVAPTAPAPLAAIVDRALGFTPARRYASVDLLLADLNAWRDGERVGAYTYAPGEALALVVRRWRVPLGALAVGLGLTVGVGVVGFLRVQAERDLVTRTLADSLERQGLAADRDGDILGAMAYATAALNISDSPLARGILVRHSGTFPLRVEEHVVGTCARITQTVCADANVVRRLDGRWRVSVPGEVLAMSEGADRVLAAVAGQVVALALGSGAELERWAAPDVSRVAQHPTVADRSAWSSGRETVIRSGGALTSTSLTSLVKALQWCGDAVCVVTASGTFYEVSESGMPTPRCTSPPGTAMGALSGERIASLGFDGILRVMRTDDCSVVGTQEQPVQLRSLDWSADGALLAGVGSTGQVHFWDGAAKEILRLPGERDGVPAVAPAPSGFWVAGPTQILRYVARPHRVGVLSTRAAGIDDLPDGRFAVAENDNLAVWGREGPGWTAAVATNGLVREGDTRWTLNRTGLQGWSFDGEAKEHRPGRSVAAGNANHTRALLADLTTVEPTDHAWLTTLPAPIRRIGPGGEGWLAMVGSGRWLYISPAGETQELGDARDQAWSTAGRRARIGMDGALTVDGAMVPPPAANLAWVSWIGEDRLLLGGPAEEYIVTADGTLQATLRMDDGRVTETRTSGELAAVLSSTRRVEVWDLSALSLAPELVRDTLQADLGVVIRGSKVGLDVP